MHSLANGTVKERAELLKRWVQSGENMQSCEHQIITSRKANINAKRKLSLISVKDRDCPGVVEETKYWVTTEESKTDTIDVGYEERMNIRATPTSANAYNILAGPLTPGMLERAKTSAPTPLSGDVLRAYDSYRDGLAAAGNPGSNAGQSAKSVAGSRRSGKSAPAKKIPLNEEHFRTDQDDDLKQDLDRYSKRLKGKAKGLINELKKR
ncbi:hypothetical protein AK812_SmicGene45598 [Symbiodinium microadriaticum]|uniref:Uncharacterized protein n=1 Tax=Symbiodinium microadriaticum TaxID=2951 RepID=A0A1Q9BVP0_SYMMI|nr:hypothetical protein AK812_SmicGene45598 [Symbiodinium microadriaticum]